MRCKDQRMHSGNQLKLLEYIHFDWILIAIPYASG